MRFLLALVVLAGCDATYETLAGGSYGTVYVCDDAAACHEWCWDGSEHDLEELLGAECHEIGLGDRIWPTLVGCAYSCPSHSGCNASCGCACEAP